MGTTIHCPYTPMLLNRSSTRPLSRGFTCPTYHSLLLETPFLFAFWHIILSWFFSSSNSYSCSVHFSGSFSFHWSPKVEGARAWLWNLFSSLCSPSIMPHGFHTTYMLTDSQISILQPQRLHWAPDPSRHSLFNVPTGVCQTNISNLHGQKWTCDS